MRLPRYLREHGTPKYRYLGRVWGAEDIEARGNEFAQMLESTGHDEELVPINTRDGYSVDPYGNVFYQKGLLYEKILQPVNG